jgi:glycosyltransferase involved in cell wall biosynthesis
MRLVALSMVKNEEYWIWYSLTSAYPHVDELLVFDNHSEDRTVEIVRSMDHIADKLILVEAFGGTSEQWNREAMLQAARERGATHIMYLDGDEVHVDENLAFCRSLLELHEHNPPLNDPPHNHMRPLDPIPTDPSWLRRTRHLSTPRPRRDRSRPRLRQLRHPTLEPRELAR